MALLNAVVCTFFLTVSMGSFYPRDVRFNSMSTRNSSIRDFSFTRRLRCAGLCDINRNCKAFLHNRHDGRCQLLSQLFYSSQGKARKHGNTIYRRSGICKVPSISKGRLLSLDGQDEGSKAQFICDDFHFTNISHGICRLDGIWEGLDKPCVLKKSPYVIKTKNRIKPGKCVIILAPTYYEMEWPKILFKTKGFQNEILHISFRYDKRLIVRNTFINGRWGNEERHTPHWPLERGREANITVCIGETCFKGYVDGVEVFTFTHRVQVNEIDGIIIEYFHVRRLTFTDWTLP